MATETSSIFLSKRAYLRPSNTYISDHDSKKSGLNVEVCVISKRHVITMISGLSVLIYASTDVCWHVTLLILMEKISFFGKSPEYNLKTLQGRHNDRNGVSNHRRLDRLPSRLSRRRSKKTSKLRVTGLCEGNSPVTGEFSAQRASNAENASIWWRRHVCRNRQSRRTCLSTCFSAI